VRAGYKVWAKYAVLKLTKGPSGLQPFLPTVPCGNHIVSEVIPRDVKTHSRRTG